MTFMFLVCVFFLLLLLVIVFRDLSTQLIFQVAQIVGDMQFFIFRTWICVYGVILLPTQVWMLPENYNNKVCFCKSWKHVQFHVFLVCNLHYNIKLAATLFMNWNFSRLGLPTESCQKQILNMMHNLQTKGIAFRRHS